MRALYVLLVTALLTAGCAGRASQGTTPAGPSRDVVDMEEMRITARSGEDGAIAFDSYDAETLFQRGIAKVRDGDCPGGVELYDRVATEFPTSRYASPALYNGALCLQEAGQLAEAAAHYERLIDEQSESGDVRHASFQLLGVYVVLERWDESLTLADALLAEDALNSDERVEAMARRAQTLAGHERYPDAAEQARAALSYTRTRSSADEVRDEYFVAAANFVLAETIRLQAAAVELPPGEVAVQRPILERRAQLILRAQRQYFNTIQLTDPHWAAAAGYRIGSMYDSFWEEIMHAPVPPPLTEMSEPDLAIYREEYRLELARLVKPLVRHSIRYWELTLLMLERTGARSEWSDRIRQDLDRARERLLEQPEGRGGLPSAQPAPGSSSEDSPEGTNQAPGTPSEAG